MSIFPRCGISRYTKLLSTWFKVHLMLLGFISQFSIFETNSTKINKYVCLKISQSLFAHVCGSFIPAACMPRRLAKRSYLMNFSYKTVSIISRERIPFLFFPFSFFCLFIYFLPFSSYVFHLSTDVISVRRAQIG